MDISKNLAERIFIQITILVTCSIAIGTFYSGEPEIATNIDIRRTLNKWRDLILHIYFNHTVVLITCLVGDFQFYHHCSRLVHTRSSTRYVTAGKWNTRPQRSTHICRIHKSVGHIINTGTIGGPVEINTTIHAACPEGHRPTVVITTIIEYTCRHQCDTAWTIIGQTDDRVLIAVGNRDNIIYNRDIKRTLAAVTTQIRNDPGHMMCTKLQSVDDIVVAILYDGSIFRNQAIAHDITAGVVGNRLGHTDIGMAVPEICSYFKILWTDQDWSFCIAELDDLLMFNQFKCTPIQNCPGAQDLLSSTTILKWFVPIPQEEITQSRFICEIISSDLRPSGDIGITA